MSSFKIVMMAIILHAPVCFSTEINKSIYTLPKKEKYEKFEQNWVFQKKGNDSSLTINESQLKHFSAFPDVVVNSDFDGGIMLTPERIVKNLNRQAETTQQNYGVLYYRSGF